VLHAFSKKTRKTPKRDIDLAGERFRAVIEERKRQKR
jgi:phage-related protein